MRNKELVGQATTELFDKRDASAFDRYFSPGYIEHSEMFADGPGPLHDLVAGLAPDFEYEQVRMLADGDLVVVHGVYSGLEDVPLVAFDLFRVERGKIAEHWDALLPQRKQTVSHHSQTDGPVEVNQPGQTEASRRLVTDFVKKILIGGAYDKLTDFIDGENYIQHNPGIGDGLSGLGAAIEAMGKQGITMEYDTLHRVVAEGEFVFTQAEGRLGGEPYRYYDLFRVENGKIAEHWDVAAEAPAELPHENGLF